MAPCDAQAEIKRLTQENEALRAHNTGLTEQLAKELQASALLRRAVEWLMKNPIDHSFFENGRNLVEIGGYGKAFEVPAEFADIIKPRSE